MIRNLIICILLSVLMFSCVHKITNEERQQVAELTVKHHFDPMNHKKLSDFHFKEFQANSDGSGYNIVILNDFMSKEDLYKYFTPQTLIFLNKDCTKITSLATE